MISEKCVAKSKGTGNGLNNSPWIVKKGEESRTHFDIQSSISIPVNK
jgi:hypothetical protein